MNKIELVSAIAEKSGLSKKDSESALEATLNIIVESVANNEPVKLIGFGSFEKRHRDARTGHDPRTKEEIQIEAKDVPAFKVGKAFKNAVK